MSILNKFLIALMFVLAFGLYLTATGVDVSFLDRFLMAEEAPLTEGIEVPEMVEPNLTYREYMDRANALKKSQDYLLAIAHYQRALSLEPRAADPHVGMAEVYLSQGNTATAYFNAEEAVRLDPDHDKARLILGQLQIEEYDFAQAEGTLAGINKKDTQTSYLLGLLAAYFNHREEAGAYLHPVVKSSATLSPKAQQIISIYRKFDDFSDGQNPHLEVLLAQGFLELGELQLAEKKAEKVSSEVPDYRDAYLIWGQALYLQGKYGESRRVYTEAIALDSVNAEAQYMLALSELALDEYESAFENFSLARTLGFEPLSLVEEKILEVREKIPNSYFQESES